MRLEDMSKEERQFHELSIEMILAKTDEEIAAANKKIRQFEKKHPDVVDEVRSRRWTDYPGTPGY